MTQDRVTDHRVGLTVGNVGGVLDGGLAQIMAALDEDFASRRVKSILAGEGDLDR
jgi:protein subunit release factor A